jgi:hypothetical protein
MTERRRLPNRRAGIGRFRKSGIRGAPPFYASTWISLGDAAAMVMKRLRRTRLQRVRR